uniref:Major facilitator superfamily (MFS) profile domain-containing protein n=1 Tax=Coturnix japonica TaxID=93934 RepID=A0A8C2SR74_COTJA
PTLMGPSPTLMGPSPTLMGPAPHLWVPAPHLWVPAPHLWVQPHTYGSGPPLMGLTHLWVVPHSIHRELHGAGSPLMAFIVSYMALAPLFGFLGDRYNRKRLLAVGLSLWVGVTMGSSFVTQQVPMGSMGLYGVSMASSHSRY